MQRNQHIEAMTEQVAESVLQRCRDQIATLSVSEHNNAVKLKEHIRLIQYLEKHAELDRCLESLPDDERLADLFHQLLADPTTSLVEHLGGDVEW